MRIKIKKKVGQWWLSCVWFFKVPGSNWITEDEHYKKKVEWTMIMATKCAVWAHTNLSPYLEYVDHSHTLRVKFLKTNGDLFLCVSNLSKYWFLENAKMPSSDSHLPGNIILLIYVCVPYIVVLSAMHLKIYLTLPTQSYTRSYFYSLETRRDVPPRW